MEFCNNRIYQRGSIVVDSKYVNCSTFEITVYTAIKDIAIFLIKCVLIIYVQRIILPMIYAVDCY